MTIQTALNMTRALLDTEIPDDVLVAWLSNHDEQFWERSLRPYGVPIQETLPYTQFIGSGQDGANEFNNALMLPDKYAAEFYPEFLTAQISRHHGDYERWNNGAMAYQTMEQNILDDITRDHRWRPPRPQDVPENLPWHPVTGLRF